MPPKVGGMKPAVPSAPRPPVAKVASKPGGIAKPAAPGGQMDLAAVVSFMFCVLDRRIGD